MKAFAETTPMSDAHGILNRGKFKVNTKFSHEKESF